MALGAFDVPAGLSGARPQDESYGWFTVATIRPCITAVKAIKASLVGRQAEKSPASMRCTGLFLAACSLLLFLRLFVRQAVNIRCQQVHLVVTLQLLLRRHLALAAVTDGLLQLGEAGTVDERARVGQVRCAHRWRTFTGRAVAGHAVGGEHLLAVGHVGLGP